MFKAAKFEEDFTLLSRKEIIELDAVIREQFNDLPNGPFMAVKILAGEKTALLLSDDDHRQIARPDSYRNHPLVAAQPSRTSPAKRRYELIDIDADDSSD